MKISLVVAMDKNRIIGANNQLPWNLPADLAHFKRLTLNKPIVMGRKTFESIGRPLPQRRNIIVTRNVKYSAEGCEVFHSLDAALANLKNEEEVMVIGGGELFNQVLSQASTLYLTIVDAKVDGDVYFPDWNANEWQEVGSQFNEADEKNPFNYTFLTLKRSE